MGGSAPRPDPNIGIAALRSAEVGADMLGWMQDQAQVTNAWAAEDRSRWNEVFRPMQDAYIEEAQNWDSPERRQQASTQAIADTRQQTSMAEQSRTRTAMAMGINPASGNFQAASAKSALDGGLAAVGAGNLAQRRVEAEGEARRANAINMGSGLAVNPATSMGLSNGAITSGGSAAMAGYGQQGNLLNTQYQQQLQSWQANNQSISGLFGAAGTILGLSSKKAKTDKKAIPDGAALGALREMPVETWSYKPGMGDGGGAPHIGPYAEDFARATGVGDGKTIDIMSQIGVTMGAVRDLDRKLDRVLKKKDAA